MKCNIFQTDMDEMASEAHLSDEKAKKAMVDAARLADELRNEQELAQAYERDRKLFECQVKDMQQRLDEAETNALKGGKKAMNKMETRIRELESEIDAENRRMADALKNLRKSGQPLTSDLIKSNKSRTCMVKGHMIYNLLKKSNIHCKHRMKSTAYCMMTLTL